jgi:hypothetical protein
LRKPFLQAELARLIREITRKMITATDTVKR